MRESRPSLFFGPHPRARYEAEWFGDQRASNASPIVVGGCARSGTTLLRVILDAHRNIACGPESRLFEPRPISIPLLADQFGLPERELYALYRSAGSRTLFIEGFAERFCREWSKSRWAEKTAKNVRHLSYVFRAFPRARFVHVVRDGRDVVCSLRHHPVEELRNGRITATGVRNPLRRCIERWTQDIDAARPYWGDPRFFCVKYERLVTDTDRCVKEILAFVGESWDECCSRHERYPTRLRAPHRLITNQNANQAVNASAVGRWQRELGDEERELFKRLGGDRLVELGYESNLEW